MTSPAAAPSARPSKNPAKVRAGRIGAATRWDANPNVPPKVVKIDDLTAPQRRLVLALVDAARREAERDPGSTGREAPTP